MREVPILFSAPMVRALLNTCVGSWPPEPIDPVRPCKGVTRRLSKQWLKVKAGSRLWVRETWASPEPDKTKPGRIAYNADGLCGCWIGGDREFIYHGRILEADGYRECFPANGADTVGLGKYSDIRSGEYPSYRYGWRPSIYMPRWACRVELECIEDAREECLEDISEDDARLEGVQLTPCTHPECRSGAARCAADSYRGAFAVLWNKLHLDRPWGSRVSLVRVGPFRRVR